ncbi:MAG: LCP family protein [Candidatus Margulisbacteria bacterium]|nr:LCP family protein [Candidatus Margulisiibacteriota bacterium]MBU1616819.1 LCP family protein [Candidatus Margulisiibacteriota bacterium]
MDKPKKPNNRTRLLALLTLIGGILYFYLNIFSPHLVPVFLRIGSVRVPTNILILGIDMNYDRFTGQRIMDMNGRTDTIIIARIDPVNYKLSLLSIPRDTLVEIPGYGSQKINAANVYGGTGLVKETLFKLTGLRIDKHIFVNAAAAVALVDLLGGVNVYVDKDMYYTDNAQKLYINLKQGQQRLSGRDAEGFLRFRHDTYGDLTRISRQQRFMLAIFKEFARPENILKAPIGLEIARQHIHTNMRLNSIIRLLNFTRMLGSADIKTFTASGEPQDVPGIGSALVMDRNNLESIVKEFK